MSNTPEYHNTDINPAAFLKVFGQDPMGAQIYLSLRAKFDVSSFVPGEPDTTAFNEGMRFLVLFIGQQMALGAISKKEEK